MLTYLHIRNFALVESLDLELAAGMTAITGETGAGKSILIDAIGLLLGDRADGSVVRHGTERADLSAVFDLEQVPMVRAWLAERDLHRDEECHIRRIITRTGRSRNYINGILQPIQVVRELGEQLVDIHGQNEHQSLLRRDAQRQRIDDYAHNEELAVGVAECYQAWHELCQELHALRQANCERDARLDVLRYHLKELVDLNPVEGELPALEQEQRRLAHASQLLDTGQRLLRLLSEGDKHPVVDRLIYGIRELDALSRLDKRLIPISELLNTALIYLQEASSELRSYVQGLDLDPGRLAQIEQRLAVIHQLARKHRLDAAELPQLRARLEAQLETLEQSETRLEALQQAVKAAWTVYQQNAEQLSIRRKAAARELSTKITHALADLGMPGGRFNIALESLDRPTPAGLEAVEFQVSANPGQPLRPLIKVASGGELSRISLAIQVITARATRTPTLIFDEVDTGIGGGVAEVVGRQLRMLGGTRQVLCVTHLPQVAVQAHRQIKVEKRIDGGTTHADVFLLTGEARIAEVARMLGGLELTAPTLAHAREMVEKVR